MANKKGTRWNLAELGRYARYFLIFKNAVDRVVRSYAESCTEQVPIDENGQPNFELVAKQCNNLMIAKDKADSLLDWYYVTYKTMAMNDKEPEVIKTPDDIQSEGVKDITVTPLYSCPIPNDISSAVDATKEELKDEGTDETGEETV